MKAPLSHLMILCAVLAGGSATFAQAGSETNAAPATTPAISRATVPVAVRSVFVDDVRQGRDPFFPNSRRRMPAVETPAVAAAAPQPSALLDQLTLKGISGVRGQRLALINSATVGVGEKADIRVAGQSIKILCREIREKSVLIELVGAGAGQTRELKLRENI